MTKTYTDLQVEASLCAWEYLCEERQGRFKAYFEDAGTPQLRADTWTIIGPTIEETAACGGRSRRTGVATASAATPTIGRSSRLSWIPTSSTGATPRRRSVPPSKSWMPLRRTHDPTAAARCLSFGGAVARPPCRDDNCSQEAGP